MMMKEHIIDTYGRVKYTLGTGCSGGSINSNKYGLKALKSGAISPEEFVTLNENIGGADTDGNFSTARAVADTDSLGIAYRAGLVSPGGNLARVATIDLRAYDETYNIPMNQLGIHQYWRSYSHRARIDAAAGGHANHALWRFGPAGVPPSIAVESFLAMDAWLTGLVASSPKEWTNAQRTQQQVAAAKPAAASDLCYLSADTTFSTKVLTPRPAMPTRCCCRTVRRARWPAGR
jgi:hypothetical protein